MMRGPYGTRSPAPRIAGGLVLALAAGVALTLGAPSASAQTLMGSGGLGIPLDPADGRVSGLGGVQAGLSQHQLLPADPASASGIPLPTITATLQPSSGTLSEGDQDVEVGGSRFPLVGLSYPVGSRTVMSASLSSFLTHEWDVLVDRTVDLGDRGEVDAQERYEAQGGVSQAQLAAARRFFDNLHLGVAAGLYTGSMERNFRRSLDPGEVGPEVEVFQEEGEWRARGASVTASALWDPHPLVRVGGGVTWRGSLRMEPVAGEVEEKSYPLPVTFRLGTTLSLVEELDLTAGLSWADWSDTGAELEDGAEVGTVVDVGAGVEWSGIVLRNRPIPLRLGYRNTDLPFGFKGEAGSESSFAMGVGINAAEVQVVPVARIDLSLERVNREAGMLSEDLWRTTVSLRLSGG